MKTDKLINISNKVTEYSLWGIIFTLPFSKSLAETFIITAIVSFFLQKVISRDFSIKKSPLMWAFILYFAVNLISVFWSTYIPLSARAIFTKVLKYIVLFYVIYGFVDSEKKLKRILVVILCSVLLITVNGLIQQFITGYDLLRHYPAFKYVAYPDSKFPTFKHLSFNLPPAERGYVTSSFPFPNDYAAWMITLLPLALALSVFDLRKVRPYIRGLGYAAVALLSYSLFLTKTRGAWLAFFIGIVFLGILKSKKLIMAFILLALVSFVFMPQHLRDAITYKLSFKDRMNMWSVSVDMIKERPVRGFGLNTYFENYKYYRNDIDKYKRGSYAHNCYLQQAVDVGIPGLFIFLYLLFSIFWFSIWPLTRMKDNFYSSCCVGIWVGLINFCAIAFVDTNFHSLPLVILFWFMTGLLFSAINIYERKT